MTRKKYHKKGKLTDGCIYVTSKKNNQINRSIYPRIGDLVFYKGNKVKIIGIREHTTYTQDLVNSSIEYCIFDESPKWVYSDEISSIEHEDQVEYLSQELLTSNMFKNLTKEEKQNILSKAYSLL
jgi:uncharacterized pyridoxamine 5'-phosphate oxidase family protein